MTKEFLKLEGARQCGGREIAERLDALDRGKAGTASWTIGLITRHGGTPSSYPIDVLLDWTSEFAGGVPPSTDEWRDVLDPWLEGFKEALLKNRGRGRRRVVLIPQCHLTMALAVGFQFRRNVQVATTVIEPNSLQWWTIPRLPEPGQSSAWTVERLDLGSGGDLALVVNITQPGHSMRQSVAANLQRDEVGTALIFEPVTGVPAKAWLSEIDPQEPHQRVMAILEQVRQDDAFAACSTVHLFFAGPAAFAILLAVEFSNFRPVQTYEWLDSRRSYVPGPLLVSS